MKVTIRIPTEQYAFIEIQEEVGTKNEAIELYRDINRELEQRTNGLKELEFNKIIDKYLTINTMTADEYESLNDSQKNIIQTLKRAFKRIKSLE